MSLSLVTGYAGKPHVKSSQDGAFNAAVYGAGKYVFDIGNQFAYEIISNNIVRVKDGYALNQGRFMGMETGDYEDVSIDNGLQGVKRSDLIVMRYTLNPDTGIETAELVVIKGTSGDVYSDPESVEGDILNGASEDDFLLYRVKIDGISIAAVEPLFTVSSSAMMMIKATEKKIDALNTNLTNDLGGITNYGSYTPTATFSSLNICTITATKKGKVIILATVNSTTTRYLYLYNTTKRKNISNKNFGDGINCILAVVSVDIGDVITLYSQFSATNTVNYSVQAFYIG